MKTLLTFFLILGSFNSFASQSSVLEAMHSMFLEGFYFGFSPDNKPCLLQVKFHSDRAEVTAIQENHKIKRIIMDGSGFRFNFGKRELLSSDKTGTFRTLAVDQVMTYTVTAEMQENGSERFIECITNTIE